MPNERPPDSEALRHDEIDDVVELALRRQSKDKQAKDEAISDDTLAAVATEMGLSTDDVLAAKTQFLQRKQIRRHLGLIVAGVAVIALIASIPLWRERLFPPDAATIGVRVQALREQGRTLRTDKRWAEAIKVYQEALAMAPDHVMILNEIGICYENSELKAEAEKHYRRSIALAGNTPDAYWAHYNLGTMFDDTTRTQDAIDAYLAAIKLKPEDPDAYSKLGLLYHRLNRDTEALKAFEDALSRDASHKEAKQGLETVRPKVTTLPQSVASRVAAEELRLKAKQLRTIGSYTSAIKTYLEALQLAPGSIDIHDDLGRVYQDAKLYDEAEKTFRKAMSLKGDAHDRYYPTFHLAFMFDDTFHRYPEALALYKQASQCWPDRSLPHNNAGWIYLELKQWDKAEQAFKTALKLQPDMINAKNGMRKLAEKRQAAR